MSVDLLILSGARQGEEFRFHHQSVTVGGEQACDISFNITEHPLVHGKVAEFVVDEYGWRIRNCGLGDWYINQDVLPTSGAAPLRSGDIVRLSELGPDLRFSIVTDDQIVVEEEYAPSDESEDEDLGRSVTTADAWEGTMPSNTYTVLVPILVLLLILLVAAVCTLLVLAE